MLIGIQFKKVSHAIPHRTHTSAHSPWTTYHATWDADGWFGAAKFLGRGLDKSEAMANLITRTTREDPDLVARFNAVA